MSYRNPMSYLAFDTLKVFITLLAVWRYKAQRILKFPVPGLRITLRVIY